MNNPDQIASTTAALAASPVFGVLFCSNSCRCTVFSTSFLSYHYLVINIACLDVVFAIAWASIFVQKQLPNMALSGYSNRMGLRGAT
jgi:hypothetical protein